MGGLIGKATVLKDGLMSATVYETAVKKELSIYIPSWGNLSTLDNIKTAGVYSIQPQDGAGWGLLIVFTYNTEIPNAVAQVLFNPNFKSRICKEGTNWTTWL